MTQQAREKIERAILQCVMENDGVFSSVRCVPEDFGIFANRKIYEAMLAIEASGKRPNDIVLLSSLLDELSFVQFNKLTNGDFYGMYWPHSMPEYVAELKSLNKKNVVSDVIGIHGLSDPDLVIQKISEKIESLSSLNTESNADDLSSVFKEIEMLSNSKGKLPGLSSGYGEIDWKIYGLNGGETYVVAARPSIGKSLFSLNVAYNVAKEGKHVVINALEERKKNIYKRLISRCSHVRLHDIMTGNIKPDDWQKIISAIEEISKLNITIIDDPGLTGAQISTNIARIHSKKKVDLTIVDHLQEVSDKGQNRHLAISGAFSTIIHTTKKLNIPLLCVSQINRNVETRRPPRPMLSDLKESGDIEAKADVVMLLYRESYYDPTASDCFEVIIAKARNGMCGIVPLRFDGSTMTIRE